jgi:hypothetical protein
MVQNDDEGEMYIYCKVCGTKKKMPVCCSKVMINKDEKLVCTACQTNEQIPICCENKMIFAGTFETG